MAETENGSKQGDLKKRLLQKALMPVVATAASAAAGYAAKKGPALFESEVAPRLKDAFEATRESATDAAGGVSEKAQRIAGGGGSDGSRRLPTRDLDQRLEARARSRAARHRAARR
jgi:hypothetical protein